MTPIKSGPSREFVVRNALVILLLVVFAAMFLRDGYGRYARDNVEKVLQALGANPEAPPTIDQELTGDRAKKLGAVTGEGSPASDVIDRLGEPGLTHGQELYYFGPGGHLRIRLQAGNVASTTWVTGVRSETDILLQRALGIGLLGAALVTTALLLWRARPGLVADDAGLHLKGGIIAWEDIVSVAASPPTHAVVRYRHEGREQELTLENYRLARLTTLIEAFRERGLVS